MTSEAYFATLAQIWRGEFVVCALGESADGWWNATHSDAAYYMHGAMGYASSFGMGLALAAPERRVWTLDSDGGICMNLGGLLTEASKQPDNLTHIILDNHCYQSIRGAPLVNAQLTDYPAIARGAGIENVQAVTTPEALEVAVNDNTDRHVLIIADVERREGSSEQFEPPPPLPFEGPEIKYRFGRHTESELGRPVFGPKGY